MNHTIVLGAAVCLSVVFLVGCKKVDVQADVNAAVAQNELRFIALVDGDGKITYPQVPEIPDWYFQKTGIRIRTATDDTKRTEMAYAKSYNEALYQTLKAQGKLQALLDNVAFVKTNLNRRIK